MADKETFELWTNIDKRIKSNDLFLKDFEIEVVVAPFIQFDDIDCDLISEVLAYPLGAHKPINYHYAARTSQIFLNNDMNWNCGYFNG